MAKTKKQHYVPRSYLRRFAFAEDSIWVFDKVRRRSFCSNLMGVANDGYFYDFGDEILEDIRSRLDAVPNGDLSPEDKQRLLDPQFVEHDLARMEGDFAATIEELLRSVTTTGKFTPDQQARMAVSVTRQMLRGPDCNYSGGLARTARVEA